jgi:hypothetical protein
MIVFRTSIALLIIGVIAGCGQNLPPGTTDPSNAKAAGQSHRAVKEHFLLLRGPTETLPQSLRSHLGRLLRGRSNRELRPFLAHRAVADEEPIWVFMERRNLCLAQGGLGSVACSKVHRAELDGVSLGVFSPPSKDVPRPHDFLLLGLAPNDVRKVEITIGKRRQLIDVKKNLYFVAGDQPILVKRLIRK